MEHEDAPQAFYDCMIDAAKRQLVDLRLALRLLEKALKDDEDSQKQAIVAIRLLHEYLMTSLEFKTEMLLYEFEHA